MKVLVCGGRNYDNEARVFEVLDAARPSFIVCGGANGADMLAVRWARLRGVRFTVVQANWKMHGAKAGPMRNQRMIDDFDPARVIAFPGGNGTLDTIRRARRAGIPVDVVDPGVVA